MCVPPSPSSEPPTELATEAKEEEAAVQARESEIARQRQAFEQQQQPEALISVDQTSSDKKVSSPAKGAKSVNTWNARRRAISFERNLFMRSHRLTLYQEICVWIASPMRFRLEPVYTNFILSRDSPCLAHFIRLYSGTAPFLYWFYWIFKLKACR